MQQSKREATWILTGIEPTNILQKSTDIKNPEAPDSSTFIEDRISQVNDMRYINKCQKYAYDR